MSYFLGIDGGGTKTAFVLIAADGSVLARSCQPSSDYHRLGVSEVSRILADGVDEICGQSGTPRDEIDFTVAGMPGYGEIAVDRAVLDAVPRRVLGHDRYLCVNDSVCGWAGSLGAADGINIVAGTGSITYGELRGFGQRVGGWGELFGDEGSAYWIAIRGLDAFARMSDGRLEKGPLYQLLRERLGVQHDLDLIRLVLTDWHKGRTQIAALSSTVSDAADGGDTVAVRILHEAAVELASLVDATRLSLGFTKNEAVAVSCSGGVFHSGTVLSAFSGALEALYDAYDLRPPLYEPDVGAALYAAKTSGSPLVVTALARLPRAEGTEP